MHILTDMANQYTYFEHKRTLKHLIQHTYRREELITDNIKHYAAKNRRAHRIYVEFSQEEVTNNPESAEIKEIAQSIMSETAKTIELCYEMKEIVLQSRANYKHLISQLII